MQNFVNSRRLLNWLDFLKIYFRKKAVKLEGPSKKVSPIVWRLSLFIIFSLFLLSVFVFAQGELSLDLPQPQAAAIYQDLLKIISKENVKIILISDFKQWADLSASGSRPLKEERFIRIALTKVMTTVYRYEGKDKKVRSYEVYFYKPFFRLGPLAHEITHIRFDRLFDSAEKKQFLNELNEMLRQEDKRLWKLFESILAVMERSDPGSFQEEIFPWIYELAVEPSWHYPVGTTPEERRWLKERRRTAVAIENKIRRLVEGLDKVPRTREWLWRLYKELGLPLFVILREGR